MGMKRTVAKLLSPVFKGFTHQLATIRKEVEETKLLTARQLVLQLEQLSAAKGINSAEFKVFSQFGEDGIIQFILMNGDIKNDTFIEFGVQDYIESNTRFLLINNNWKGLVFDGSAEYINLIQHSQECWRHDLTAVHAFITKDNINDLFSSHGYSGEIGILSVDIDGNDYWVLKEVNVVDPEILILEYNSCFGVERAVTVPYREDFQRTKAHYSNLYWGASLKALHMAATDKGYSFLGCNSNGNNAFFVRNDRLGNLTPVSLEAGYRESRFRESRGRDGRLTYLGGRQRLEPIKDMSLYDVEEGTTITVADLIP